MTQIVRNLLVLAMVPLSIYFMLTGTIPIIKPSPSVSANQIVKKLENGMTLTCSDGNKTFEVALKDGWRTGVIYFSNRDDKVLIGNCK